MEEGILYIPTSALERKMGHKSEKGYRKGGHDVDLYLYAEQSKGTVWIHK